MKIAISAAAFSAVALGFGASAAAQTAAPTAKPAAAAPQARPATSPAMQHAPGMSHQDMMQGKAPSAGGMSCGCPCCKGMMQQSAAKAS